MFTFWLVHQNEISLLTLIHNHNLKLSKSRSSRQVRQNFFSQRIINSWNNLPRNTVTSTSVNMFNFKNRLDDYWKDVGNKS